MSLEHGEYPSSRDSRAFVNIPEDHVLAFIDGIVEIITEELIHPDGRPTISLKRRSSQTRYFLNSQTGALEFEGSNIVSTYTWPGKNAQEAWYFGMALEPCDNDFITNKRCSYYSQNSRAYIRSGPS